MTNHSLDIQPAALSDLVAYQPGAIVSRTLLKASGGNLTLFAFDQGEKLSEHSTPHDALAYLLEGRMEITIGGEMHAVGEGEILPLPASVPHAVLAKSQSKLLLVMVQGRVEEG